MMDAANTRRVLPGPCPAVTAGSRRIALKRPLPGAVDLRDGNQSPDRAMSLEEKLEFFQMLVKIGFKEIGGLPCCRRDRVRVFCAP